MIEQDTVKLLRECDSGVRMGVDSINEVMDHVKSEGLKDCLTACKREHEALDKEIRTLLDRYADNGKAPSPVAKAMSHMKTEWKLANHDTDRTVADLMTDGCNMGVKSLSRYLNQYKAASEETKDVAKRLIASEERLSVACRAFL